MNIPTFPDPNSRKNAIAENTWKWEKRIADLYSRMTLEEKIGQMNMSWFPAFKNEEESYRRVQQGEIGAIILSDTPWPGNGDTSGVDVDYYNRLQQTAVKKSRLGIPLLFGRDIIHGHRTIAPIPLAQAASFDPTVAEAAAELSAQEATADGVKWTFAPMLDICRDPRWGRVIEPFGEDPYLASQMAVAAVHGYQGDDPAAPDRMLACAKHFAGYGYAEGGRDYDAVEISRFTLQNTVLRPFLAAVKEGKAASIMTAFHVNGGVPASADEYLLKDTLRGVWNFDGMVVSDFGSVDEIETHGAAPDARDAARRAVGAGVDMEMCDLLYPKYLAELYREGKIDDAVLERAVKAVLRGKFRAGLFENPYIDTERRHQVMFTAENRATVRRLAASGMVLARNRNHLLPLDPKRPVKIALMGPMAHEKRSLLGAWNGSGKTAETLSIAEAFRQYPSQASLLMTDSQLADDQLALVRRADIVICCVGESQERTGESHALAKLQLPAGQEELIEAVGEWGKPLIVVCCSGRPLPMTSAERYADAILYAWHGGTETAAAIADVIFGLREPTGRFPLTVPRHAGQIPLYYGRKIPGKVTKPFLAERNYSFYDDEPLTPLYPFGYGLSYTEFQLSSARLKSTSIRRGESNEIAVTCSNIGKRSGTVVIQCYLRDPRAAYARPGKELIGFRKVRLQAGENTVVTFSIDEAAMGYYDENGQRLLDPGLFQVGVGLDSTTSLCLEFQVC